MEDFTNVERESCDVCMSYACVLDMFREYLITRSVREATYNDRFRIDAFFTADVLTVTAKVNVG